MFISFMPQILGRAHFSNIVNALAVLHSALKMGKILNIAIKLCGLLLTAKILSLSKNLILALN